MQASASILTEAQTGPALLSSARGTVAIAKETDHETGSAQEDGNCFRGILVGLCVECALGFCVYGVWHIWHLVR
jgi:hypothetical protein